MCWGQFKAFFAKKKYMWPITHSPHICIKACKDSGYQLAGVQHTNQCFCDNTPPPSSDLTMIVTMFAPEIPIKSVGAVGGWTCKPPPLINTFSLGLWNFPGLSDHLAFFLSCHLLLFYQLLSRQASKQFKACGVDRRRHRAMQNAFVLTIWVSFSVNSPRKGRWRDMCFWFLAHKYLHYW